MLIDTSSTGLALCSFDGKIIDANASFLEIIKLNTDNINNLIYFDLIADELQEKEKKALNTLKKTGSLNPYESIYITKDKERIDVRVAGKLLSIKGNQFIWLSVDNITLQKAYEHQLIRDSHHDSLTGLANRLFFNQILHQTLARAERTHRTFALFFIDLNKFKEVNDTYGHECGDNLLKAIAERLQKNIRADDFIARLGGDEFTIIFESIKNQKEAITVVKTLMEKTKQPLLIEGCEINPSISIGIAFYPEQACNAETLLKCADKAMYYAKHKTEEHYFIYDSSLNFINEPHKDTL